MVVPNWAWAIPLIVSVLALTGILITVAIQLRNFDRQLRSAHTLKISEMRQAWINNLRDSMAAFQSFGVTPGLDQHDKREWYEAGTKIELMMNPSDPDFEDLKNSMYRFLGAVEVTDKYSANPEYIQICQRILKREWEVLKQEVHSAGIGESLLSRPKSLPWKRRCATSPPWPTLPKRPQCAPRSCR